MCRIGRFNDAETSGGGPFLTARLKAGELVCIWLFGMRASVPRNKFSTYSETRLSPIGLGPLGFGWRASIPFALSTNTRLLSLVTFVGYQPVGTTDNCRPVARSSAANVLVPASVT